MYSLFQINGLCFLQMNIDKRILNNNSKIPQWRDNNIENVI